MSPGRAADPDACRLAPLLWLLLGLFCLRVLGQALVAFFGVGWLPPMDQWYSSLLPYPLLLPAQILIIALYGKICLDFTRGRGPSLEPRPAFRSWVWWFGWIYLAGMVLRYVLRMALVPEARWLGGTIPIFFHWVLAGFVLLFARFHRRRAIAPESA